MPYSSNLPDTTGYAPLRGLELRRPRYAPPPGGDPLDILRKLWRRKWLIALTALGTFVLAAVVISMLTPRYTAESQVLVGIEEPKVSNIESVLKGITANLETVQSEAYVVQSRAIAARVVNRLALDKSPEFNPELRTESAWHRYLYDAIDFITGLIPRDWINPDADKIRQFGRTAVDDQNRTAGGADDEDQTEDTSRDKDRVVDVLLDHVNVTPLNRSHVLAIDVQSQNSIMASRIANMFADVYVEQSMMGKTTATEKANAWLDKQIADMQAKVEADDRAVEEYRQQNGLYETKTDTVVAQQIAELNTQLIGAQNAKAEAEAKLSQAEKALQDPDAIDSLPAVLESPLIQSLREKQVDLERQAADLASTYGKKHPAMIDMEAQLQDVRHKIQLEVKKIIAGIRHEADSADARYKTLESSLMKMQGNMGQMNQKSVKLHQLENEAEASRALFQSLLERSKETTATESLHATPDATLISAASTPDSPSFPPRLIILAVAILGGAGFGGLLALLTENLDRTFRTSQEIEEMTGFPTLALVPALGWRERSGSHVLRDPDSPFSESLRTLYARLLLSGSKRRSPKVVMLTSATPDEGKSRIGYSLAQLVAYAGRRVVVIDCDWKRPTLHKLFRTSGQPGLAELLRGDAAPDEAVHQDPVSGAHAIFAGSVKANAHDILRFERLPMLLETLARHYDLIVVDTPPVLAGAEVTHLSRMMDAILFVVKWGDTQREVAMNGLKQIVDARGPVAGVVLSQVNPKRYGRYGYGDLTYFYQR